MALSTITVNVSAKPRWWFVPALYAINCVNLGAIFKGSAPWVPMWMIRLGIKTKISGPLHG
ncbi:hypothetical protein ACX0KM_10750 [Pseudomonas promysalinigenes]|uniref:Uncharacterized protein n=1 Tax=Pseudomonas juntendi TaxID=2666183 RepID=A0A7W2LZ17_9PSED|nr:hypothetical protein [Pseudomonas juntendi]MBA6134651.1 hypothetical protein [Pseudomonas juntendi]MBA6149662.1 hypothetical protein [Pseudomonas juntendi]MCK2117157.1 hypothetical protein [Pseudomonas juntendi]